MVSLFGVISTRMSSSSGAAKLLVLLFALTFATMELAYAEKKMLFFCLSQNVCSCRSLPTHWEFLFWKRVPRTRPMWMMHFSPWPARLRAGFVFYFCFFLCVSSLIWVCLQNGCFAFEQRRRREEHFVECIHLGQGQEGVLLKPSCEKTFLKKKKRIGSLRGIVFWEKEK